MREQERKKERDKESKRERKRERKRESLCICVCVRACVLNTIHKVVAIYMYASRIADTLQHTATHCSMTQSLMNMSHEHHHFERIQHGVFVCVCVYVCVCMFA